MTNSYPGLPASSTCSHVSLGLKSIGPFRVDNIVSRLCPLSATLGYDTTVLEHRRNKVTMPRRCIAYQAEYRLECQLEKYGLKAASRDQICEMKSCFKAGFGDSRFCKDHLSGWRDLKTELDLQQLQIRRNHFFPVLHMEWTDEPAIGSILALRNSIQAGKPPISSLRFIDLEFNTVTGRVFEINMCDAYGTMTMDYLTSHKSEPFQAVTKNRAAAERGMDRVKRNSVDRHYCTQGPMTVKQVANELRL